MHGVTTKPAAAAAAAAAPDRAVLLSSALLGFGLLLTYNFILNLIPFFEATLAWPEAGYFVALALTYPSIAVQFVMLTVGGRAPAWLRIRAALLTNAAALSLVVAAASAARPSRGLVLALLACSGVATSVLEASIFGFLSELGGGGAAAQFAMAGAGAAGVAACVLQMVLTAALPVAASAALYAAIGVAVLLTCVHAHWRLLQRLPPPLPQQQQLQQQSQREQSQRELAATTSDEGLFAVGAAATGGASETPVVNLLAAAAHAQQASAATAAAPSPQPEAWRESPTSAAAAWARNLLRVGRVVALPATAIFSQFVATFLVFPGLTATVEFRGAPDSLKVPWFTVLLFVFGVFDVAGRSLAGLHAPPAPLPLLGYALARFLFTPLVAGCAFGWPGFGDAAAVLVMAAFGLTNGHVATLSMMHASSPAVAARDRELAGFLLVAFLHFGIVAGSNVALFFEAET